MFLINKKPLLGTLLDNANPYSRGLKNAFLFNEGAGMVGDQLNLSVKSTYYPTTTQPTWKSSGEARGIEYNGSTTGLLIGKPSQMDYLVNSPFTIHISWVCPPDGIPIEYTWFARGYIEVAGVRGMAVTFTATNIYFFRNTSGAGVYRYALATWSPNYDQVNNIMVVYNKEAVSMQIYHNGVNLDVTYPNSNPDTADISFHPSYDDGWGIGTNRYAGSNAINGFGIIDDLKIWNRALTSYDAQQLHLNKHQMFLPFNRAVRYWPALIASLQRSWVQIIG